MSTGFRHDGRIKETKKHDESDIHQGVQKRTGGEVRSNRFDPWRFKESRNSGRKRNNGRGKNRRDNSRRVNLERNMSALSPIDPPTDDTFCILNRHLPTSTLQKNNGRDDAQHHYREYDKHNET